MTKESAAEPPWPCDWEGHELQQLRRGAQRTFRENLQWLENATEVAGKMLESRAKAMTKAAPARHDS